MLTAFGTQGLPRLDRDLNRMAPMNQLADYFVGDKSPTNDGFWQTIETRRPELGCSPVGKQDFGNSGSSDVADP